MIRRLNYTGRKKIPTECIRFRITDQVPPCFDADLRLDDMDFPAEARVFVDVSQGASTTTRRFDFGTLALLRPPQERSLAGFDPTSLQFEVKVVESVGHQAGKLLGISTAVRPRQPGDPHDASILPLLPVRLVDLDAQVWSLAFDRARPHLLLNKQVPGIHDMAKTNGMFFSLVYPAVVRSVLTRIIIVEGILDPAEDDLETWTSLWLRWAIARHPDQVPAAGDSPELLEWVEDVVAAFCKERATLNLFLDSCGTEALDGGAR